MPLIQFAQVLIVVGVLLCLVNRFIPMAGSVKSILAVSGKDGHLYRVYLNAAGGWWWRRGSSLE